MSDGKGLPNGWAVETLDAVSASARPRGNPQDFVGRDFVGLEHIESHTTRLIGSVPAESMKSSGVQFQPGDVLYARMRPYLNKVWCADRVGLCSGEFFVFSGDETLDGRFLTYRMSMQDFVAYSNRTATGDRPRADLEHINRFIIEVPPRAEQARIADHIDELFSDLAAGLAALERVQKKLKRYRSAVLHAAVTGRLTEAWRKEHGPPAEPGERLLERLLVERRRQWEERTLADYVAKGKQPPKNWKQRYKEPVEPKTDDLPELPEGWCWASGGQLVSALRSGTAAVPTDTPTDKPILRSSAVRPGFVDLDDHRYLPADVEPNVADHVVAGTLLFVRLSGSLHLAGACGYVPSILNIPVAYPDRLFAATCLSDEIARYLEIVFQSRIARDRIEPKAKSTAGHQRISMGAILDQPIPLPSNTEMTVVLDILQEKASQIEALEAEVERGLARAARLRQAILKAAFAGELVPQDPNDEPAYVLLDRIRAERKAIAVQSNGRPKRAARKKASPKKKTAKTTTKKARKS